MSNAQLFKKLENGTIGIPEPEPLPDDTEPVAYHIVADDAFTKRNNRMKPYPKRNMANRQRIVIYRLSRVRRIVGNVFEILAHLFRCLLTTVPMALGKVVSVVMATCVLNNLILTSYPRAATDIDREDPNTREVTRGAWRNEVGEKWTQGLQTLAGNTSTKTAKDHINFLQVCYNILGGCAMAGQGD